MARFIHLATGTKFTKIQNSDINKKLAKVPNINTNKVLVKDLIIIKSLFLEFEMKEIVQLIDSKAQCGRNTSKSEHLDQFY